MRRQDALTCKPTPMWRKALAWITSLAMVLMFIPAVAIPLPAWADDATPDNAGVTYLDADGTTKVCTNYVEVTSNDTDWGTGGQVNWYVASGAITINQRVNANGDIHLILADSCALTVNDGINVNGSDSNLTIYGQSVDEEKAGVLQANSSISNAGIGSNKSGQSGVVAINGGVINVSGGRSGSGIGCGWNGQCKEIVIRGGKVSAKSGWYAPAIGNGNSGALGNIIVTGGNVAALSQTQSGSLQGPGIGAQSGTCGKISIHGGVINAQGGLASGIGKSSEGKGSLGEVEVLNGAVVFANSIEQIDRSSWNGIIFEGANGVIYGSSVTLKDGFSIDSGKTLTVENNQTLTIPASASVANNGTVANNGIIRVMQGGSLNGNITGANARAVILEPNGHVDLGDTAKATYGADVSLPASSVTKTGYTFGWFTNSSLTRESFTTASKATSSDVTYYAGFAPNTDTKYRVEHYKQRTDHNEYELQDAEFLTGTTDATVSATGKDYEGFAWNRAVSGTVSSGNIAGDGSLVLKLYYDRAYDVTINLGNGMKLASGDLGQTKLLGAMNVVVITAADDYYFPTDYKASSSNGISVTRDSYSQVAVSGTPTANTTITLPDATQKSAAAVPAAIFTATGSDSGMLSNVSKDMQFSLNAGGTWITVDESSVNLANLKDGSSIQIKIKGGDTTLESSVQTINISKAEAPTSVTSKPSSGVNDGALVGTTAGMEYSKAGEDNWKDCTDKETTGLPAGEYKVRVKAASSILASDAQVVAIDVCAVGLIGNDGAMLKYYDSLQNALNDVSGINGNVLKLFANSSLPYQDWNGNITVDLNGYKVSDGGLVLADGASLVLVDSSASKDGAFADVTVKGGASLDVKGAALGKLTTIDKTAKVTLTEGSKISGLDKAYGSMIADWIEDGYYVKEETADRCISVCATLRFVSDDTHVVTKVPASITGTTMKGTLTHGESISSNLIPRFADVGNNIARIKMWWYCETQDGAKRASGPCVVTDRNGLIADSGYSKFSRLEGVIDNTLNAFCDISAEAEDGHLVWSTTLHGYEVELKAGDLSKATVSPHNATELVYAPDGVGSKMQQLKFYVFHNGETDILREGVDYKILNGSDFASNVGKHELLLEGIGNYTGSKLIYEWYIAKALVTVTVKDRNIYVGDTAPDLSKPEPGRDYTVSGLLDNDKLVTAPVLRYLEEEGEEITPDSSKPGQIARIVANGADAGKEYVIVYVEGTLTASIPTPSPTPDPKPDPKPDPTPEPGAPGAEVIGTDDSGNKVSGAVVGSEEIELPGGGKADGSIEFTGTTSSASSGGGGTGTGDGSGTGGSGSTVPATSVKVPETVTVGDKTYAVVKVADNAFAGQRELTEVTLPETIAAIGKNAFENTGITAIELPGSIATIGDNAFANTLLESVVIPKSVASIGKNAFKGCKKLKDVNMTDSSVAEIASGAFAGTGIESVELPETVKTVGAGAFENCKDLVFAETNAVKIGTRAFAACESLKKVTSKAKAVGAEAFKGCSSLVKVDISKAAEIGAKAFSGCKDLKKATLGTGLKSIGKEAFKGCKELKSITVTSKQLSKKQIDQCLKGSKVEQILVQVGAKKQNQKFAEKYAKFFTKKIAGKRVSVKAAKKPLKK